MLAPFMIWLNRSRATLWPSCVPGTLGQVVGELSAEDRAGGEVERPRIMFALPDRHGHGVSGAPPRLSRPPCWPPHRNERLAHPPPAALAGFTSLTRRLPSTRWQMPCAPAGRPLCDDHRAQRPGAAARRQQRPHGRRRRAAGDVDDRGARHGHSARRPHRGASALAPRWRGARVTGGGTLAGYGAAKHSRPSPLCSLTSCASGAALGPVSGIVLG